MQLGLLDEFEPKRVHLAEALERLATSLLPGFHLQEDEMKDESYVLRDELH